MGDDTEFISDEVYKFMQIVHMLNVHATTYQDLRDLNLTVKDFTKIDIIKRLKDG